MFSSGFLLWIILRMLAEDPSGILSFLTCIETFPQAKFDKIHAKQTIYFGKALFLQMDLVISRIKPVNISFLYKKIAS